MGKGLSLSTTFRTSNKSKKRHCIFKKTNFTFKELSSSIREHDFLFSFKEDIFRQNRRDYLK